MKQVIRELPKTEFVSFENVSEHKFYGMLQHKTKYLLVKTGQSYDFLSFRESLNRDFSDQERSTGEEISYFLNTGQNVIFEFDSAEELLKWLSE